MSESSVGTAKQKEVWKTSGSHTKSRLHPVTPRLRPSDAIAPHHFNGAEWIGRPKSGRENQDVGPVFNPIFGNQSIRHNTSDWDSHQANVWSGQAREEVIRQQNPLAAHSIGG